jgi:hypothetical protein
MRHRYLSGNLPNEITDIDFWSDGQEESDWSSATQLSGPCTAPTTALRSSLPFCRWSRVVIAVATMRDRSNISWIIRMRNEKRFHNWQSVLSLATDTADRANRYGHSRMGSDNQIDSSHQNAAERILFYMSSGDRYSFATLSDGRFLLHRRPKPIR